MNHYDPYFNPNDSVNYSDDFNESFSEGHQDERLLPGLFGGPSQGGFFPGPPGNFFSGGPGGSPQGGPFPGGPGQNVQPPNSPPPNFTPKQADFQTKAVDPGSIQGCMFRFTYIWLRRDGFWFYPIFIGRRSISGFRWTGFRWAYYGVDLRSIQSFQCY